MWSLSGFIFVLGLHLNNKFMTSSQLWIHTPLMLYWNQCSLLFYNILNINGFQMSHSTLYDLFVIIRNITWGWRRRVIASRIMRMRRYSCSIVSWWYMRSSRMQWHFNWRPVVVALEASRQGASHQWRTIFWPQRLVRNHHFPRWWRVSWRWWLAFVLSFLRWSRRTRLQWKHCCNSSFL